MIGPAVAPAYEHCRRLAREARSSFYAGMRLLPPDRRDALFAVYALARRIDDIADGDLDAAERLVQLGAMRKLLDGPAFTDDPVLDDQVLNDPVLIAVADAARRFPIPLAAFGELIDGAEADVRGTTYDTFEELELYCRCVAGSIGRLALGVFDCRDRERGAVLADELGIALQIGNILRDVGEDAAHGRVYLPREDIARFGCSVAGIPPGPLELKGPAELVLAFEAERGLERLGRALALLPLLDGRSARCVLAMAGKYRVLLERVAADPVAALHERVRLRPWEKGLVLTRSILGIGA